MIHPTPIATRFGEPLTPRQLRLRATLTAAPALLWLLLFCLIPLALIASVSFLSRDELGRVTLPLTLDNYRRFAGFGLFGFDPLQPLILARSLAMGLLTALLCAALGLPLAFFIAQLPKPWRTAALTLVVIPFWTNLLIRTYAWQLLLSPNGWLARLANFLHLTNPGDPLYPGLPAVAICLLCDYLPLMTLPLYASVEKLDWTLVEAAADLGASPTRAFRHALLPQITPGLGAGFLLVFLPASGQFVIPDLLGGAKTMMLGNAIQQQFGPSLDWPYGSAIACAALSLVLLGLWLHRRRSPAPLPITGP